MFESIHALMARVSRTRESLPLRSADENDENIVPVSLVFGSATRRRKSYSESRFSSRKRRQSSSSMAIETSKDYENEETRRKKERKDSENVKTEPRETMRSRSKTPVSRRVTRSLDPKYQRLQDQSINTVETVERYDQKRPFPPASPKPSKNNQFGENHTNKKRKYVRKSLEIETFRPDASVKYEEQDEDELPGDDSRKNYPIMVLIRHDIDANYDLNKRIKVMSRKFQSTIPAFCTEAIRAQRYGGLSVKYDWPGIPTRKFGRKDLKEFGNKTDWPVQVDLRYWWPRLIVYYEGWTCKTMSWQSKESFESTANEMLRDSQIRKRFMNALKASIPADEMNDFVEHCPYEKMKNPRNLFWLYEDMTYFHSILNKEVGSAPIYYMSCSKSKVRPPYYAFSAVNIVEFEAFKACLKHDANKKWKDLSVENSVSRSRRNACETPDTCTCDLRFGTLYAKKHVQHLKYSPNSLLDFKGFNRDEKRIVMECSDECGCSSSCPRRRLQRGQQLPLVVYYESNKKGFGLRAAANIPKGSLICEYTGEMFLLPESEWPKPSEKEVVEKIEEVKVQIQFDEKEFFDLFQESSTELIETPSRRSMTMNRRVLRQHDEAQDKLDLDKVNGKGSVKREEDDDEKLFKDTSYEAAFSLMDPRIVICALNKGNVARFINHSCSPNTVFVEVYSRRHTSDPLIPRIAVYATQKIALGQEITVSYWTRSEQAQSIPSSIRCQCGAPDCMKKLPGM
uniref:SET domain-containing protein n=1 Tax=Caenorhabditis japonica TaxID=281687 RepID=A0A8R1I8C1_CAEJA